MDAHSRSLEGGYSTPAIAEARHTWLRRMAHEHQSWAVFARFLPQLIEAGGSIGLKTAVLGGAIEELKHAETAAGVVTILGGAPRVEIDLATEPLPEHDG